MTKEQAEHLLLQCDCPDIQEALDVVYQDFNRDMGAVLAYSNKTYTRCPKCNYLVASGYLCGDCGYDMSSGEQL